MLTELQLEDNQNTFSSYTEEEEEEEADKEKEKEKQCSDWEPIK